MTEEYGIPAWMKKATPFVYLRLSSEYQAKGDAGKPLDKQSWSIDQLEAVKSFLKANGMKMPKEANIFRDLASGGTMDRAGLQSLIEAVMSAKGRAYVAVVEPSRFGRNSTLAFEQLAPLYRKDIPLLSTDDALVSGTLKEPRTNAHLLFTIRMGVSEVERGTLSTRVNRRIGQRKKQGILSAAIGSLFPFARKDPLDVLLENESLIDVPTNEGGGQNALGRLVVSGSAPNGAPAMSWTAAERKRLEPIRAKLTPEEFNAWKDYRRKIRAIYASRDFDPARGAKVESLNRKDIDWGVKALNRMAGGFIAQPYNDIYFPLEDETIEDILATPLEFLSDGDKKLYRRIVSKR
jgi:DNA invertase Pin-like site-specific DNA recombinase